MSPSRKHTCNKFQAPEYMKCQCPSSKAEQGIRGCYNLKSVQPVDAPRVARIDCVCLLELYRFWFSFPRPETDCSQ
ncbi:hypothetical protein OPV22_006595 [Ensete ventricosum]|uniref:Uncharacterized protein n=1 Tax=Ensete ventricosum TaxID=4639 RepID=A0AAV8RQ07_ENSVE|nr:hypothetical protein OPV22_006595 [Ensete ventricosum]